MTHFGRQLFTVLEHQPEKDALICTEIGVLSRASCLNAVNQVIASISAAGVAANARIVIIAPSARHMTFGFLACLKGHVAAPLNPAYTFEEFLFYLRDLKPELVLLGSGSSAEAHAAVKQCGIAELTIDDDIFQNRVNPLPNSLYSNNTFPALILHTSGTTARPKMVELTQENLAASCANIGQSLRLTDQDISLCTMPLFHIHGLMANLCAALLAGGAVVIAGKFSAQQFVVTLEQHRPTWYSAVPTHHLALINYLEARDTPVQHHLRFIRSSSASLPPSVITRLERYFAVPVIEAYGMTEATHQIASNPLPPEKRKPSTVGLARGTNIRILDSSGQCLPAGSTGNIAIQGKGITPGYVENPLANAEAFQNGFFATGDLGFLDSEGYLTLTGRSKEILNRAGLKISPREIDEALLDIEGVADAVAFAQPHRSLGEDIVAAVCLTPGANLSPEDIRGRLFERLADFKVPSQIVIVEELPVGATGKRQRLQMWDALKPHFAAAYRAPTTAVETMISELFAEALNMQTIGLDENFFNCGGDSILGLDVTALLGEHLDCNIAPTLLFRHPTPGKLSGYVCAQFSPGDLKRLEAEVAIKMKSLSEG